MLAVPVFDMNGTRQGAIDVDPATLGGKVRHRLIKQAIVAYQDHFRQDSACTKRRSDVEGSTRKLYRQKGTGNARAGMIRTPVRRGGGRTFARRYFRSVKELPKKMRRVARDSAILAKIQAEEVLVVNEIRCPQPKTKVFAAMLSALGVERGAVVALHERDQNAILSGRNVANTEIRHVDDLNAHDVLLRSRLIFTRSAFERIVSGGGKSTKGRG